MAVFEYPDYQSDKDQVAAAVARIEDVDRRLTEMIKALVAIGVQAEDASGDVQVSVNHAGQLMSLSLAQGCTTRYTHTALTDLINDTLAGAVAAAAEEVATGTGTEDDEGELEAAVQALADPDSEVWQ